MFFYGRNQSLNTGQTALLSIRKTKAIMVESSLVQASSMLFCMTRQVLLSSPVPSWWICKKVACCQSVAFQTHILFVLRRLVFFLKQPPICLNHGWFESKAAINTPLPANTLHTSAQLPIISLLIIYFSFPTFSSNPLLLPLPPTPSIHPPVRC